MDSSRRVRHRLRLSSSTWTRAQKDSIIAYFDAGCVTTEAARRLNLSVRAITYRLDRIHRLTGADPDDPTQRYALQTAVIEARLLGWPDRELCRRQGIHVGHSGHTPCRKPAAVVEGSP